MNEYKVLDLFSGIGGFSLGLDRAGMQTVAFCEIDPFCRKVLTKHWPGVKIHDDVTKLDGSQYVGAVDVICGGFPCQDISVGHTWHEARGLDGERSGLWWEYARIIGEVRPKWVIVENVAALRTRGLGSVLQSLDSLGYVGEWHLIPGAAAGAEHPRERVWIIAHNQGLGVERLWPEGFPLPHSLAHPFLPLRRGDGQWEIEPDLRRTNDGIPGGMVTLATHALGNAIVPQMAEIIGKAIINQGRNLAT